MDANRHFHFVYLMEPQHGSRVHVMLSGSLPLSMPCACQSWCVVADPATPHETGLTKQGIKDNAVTAANKFVSTMLTLRDAVNNYNSASIQFAGAQAAFIEAGGTEDEAIEISKQALRRNGVSEDEITKSEAEVRGEHIITATEVGRVL